MKGNSLLPINELTPSMAPALQECSHLMHIKPAPEPPTVSYS